MKKQEQRTASDAPRIGDICGFEIRNGEATSTARLHLA
jgi:hypothetical protein